MHTLPSLASIPLIRLPTYSVVERSVDIARIVSHQLLQRRNRGNSAILHDRRLRRPAGEEQLFVPTNRAKIIVEGRML